MCFSELLGFYFIFFLCSRGGQHMIRVRTVQHGLGLISLLDLACLSVVDIDMSETHVGRVACTKNRLE